MEKYIARWKNVDDSNPKKHLLCEMIDEGGGGKGR